MPSAIELRFDAVSEAAIRALWVVASAHFGTDYLLRNDVVPHVALLVSNDALHGVFNNLQLMSMTLTLYNLSFFSHGRVAFLHAAENPVLRRYQQDCYRTAVGRGIGIHAYYSPERWYPHCSIAQECTMNREVEFDVQPIDVTVSSLIYVEYPPTALVAEKKCEALEWPSTIV